MEDVRHVCRSIKLPPSSVTTIIKNADKIKRTLQHSTAVTAMQVSYTKK